MKRELLSLEDKDHRPDTWCCPGHDKWPAETYRNNRSKKARSRDKQKEHKYVRSVAKQILDKEINGR